MNDRVQSFDFLRGVAILGVVTFHVYAIFDPYNSVVSAVAPMGVYGVQLFFIVSALTMCLMWQRRASEYRPVLKFYVRRILRIAPPFWLAMIGYIALNGVGPSQWSPEGIGARQIVLTSAFLHGYLPDTINSIVPGGWSIAVEMTFYAVFPVVVALKLSVRGLATFAFLVYLANVLLMDPWYQSIFAANANLPLKDFLYFQFFNQAPVFFVGMALFKIVSDGPAGGWVLLALAWIVVAFILKYLGFHASPFFWVLVSALLLFSWGCLSFRVSLWPINRLGKLSYAVYLTHFAVIQLVETTVRDRVNEYHSMALFLSALVITLLLCVVAASISQATIEKWSAVVAKRIIDQLTGRNAGVSVTGTQL